MNVLYKIIFISICRTSLDLYEFQQIRSKFSRFSTKKAASILEKYTWFWSGYEEVVFILVYLNKEKEFIIIAQRNNCGMAGCIYVANNLMRFKIKIQWAEKRQGLLPT